MLAMAFLVIAMIGIGTAFGNYVMVPLFKWLGLDFWERLPEYVPA